MRSLKLAALAAFVLAVLGLTAATAPSADAKDKKHPVARKMLIKTTKVMIHAHHAVKKGGEGKALYRSAWIHQMAARKAIRHHKPGLAAALSLKARHKAREAIKANKGELKGDEATDAADETKEAEGASEAEVTAAVSEEEKAAPSEEEVLKEEPSTAEDEKE